MPVYLTGVVFYLVYNIHLVLRSQEKLIIRLFRDSGLEFAKN